MQWWKAGYRLLMVGKINFYISPISTDFVLRDEKNTNV